MSALATRTETRPTPAIALWGRIRSIVRGLTIALATLLALSIVIFVVVNMVPVDAARANLGRSATVEQLALYRAEFHLDEPILARYISWLRDVLAGDFGTSLAARRPVTELIGSAVLPSLTLALVAMLISTALGVSIGIVAGRNVGGRADTFLSNASLAGAAFPPFAVAIFLIAIVGVQLRWLPVDSTAVTYATGWQAARVYILPALALAISIAPYIGRMIRTSVGEAVSSAFVRAARLRGIPERSLMWRHVLPVAMGPAIAVIALNLAELLVGLVVIEEIFGFPGLGKLLVDAVGAGDVPLVQAIVLLSGAAYIVTNWMADSVSLTLDPRLRASS